MKPTVLVATLSLLAHVLAGCADSEAPAPVAETAAGGEAAPPVAPPGPMLSLLDAGAEPRRALRYDLEEGLTEEVRIDLTMALSTVVGDLAAEVEQAPTRFVFQLGPVRRVNGDRYSFALGIRDVELLLPGDVDEETARMVRETLQPLTTLSGWAEIDAMGVVQRASLDIPAELNERTRAALGNIWTSMVSVPFPAEAVGARARWQVERTLELPHATVQQTATYTVTALDEDGVQLQMTVRQTAAPQPMRGLGADESGRVEAYEATGLGNLAVDLHRLAPRSTVDLTTQVRGTVTSQGETVPLRMHLRTVVEASGAQ